MMMGNYKKNRKLYTVIGAVSCAILVAVGLQLAMLNRINSQNFDNTSKLLLDRVINVIESNEQNEKALIASLKDDYVVRAKTVAYIIDAKPEVEYDVKELEKIANLVSVDEVELFDKTGAIYSGTTPQYIGYNFNSGVQMSYFKPMLDDKSLTLCQDLMPNTSEQKKMMYAMTWNEAGTHMVQVGINPVRLLHELKQNEISEVVSRIPTYEGMHILVANRDTGKIYGATNKDNIGKNLDDLGIHRQQSDEPVHKGHVYVNGEEYAVTFGFTGPYTVGIAWSVSEMTRNSALASMLVGGYLLLAALIIIFMVLRVLKTKQDRDNQFEILLSMSRIYRGMDLISLEKDVYINYSGHAKDQTDRKPIGQAGQRLHDMMKGRTIPEDWETMQSFIDLSTVADRLEGKKIISLDFMTPKNRWYRASFIAIKRIQGKIVTVMFTLRDIDNEKRREESLLYASHTDELTQCRNRRAYMEDMATTVAMKKPFVYVSMDVNGLKQVNDGLGHEAGDELIRGAAGCMKRCFGSYGKVYRIGGDEFSAILMIDDTHLADIQKDFKETVSKWQGTLVKRLAISSGYVYSEERNWPSVEDIEREGDKRMYEEKNRYYSMPEHDRRK